MSDWFITFEDHRIWWKKNGSSEKKLITEEVYFGLNLIGCIGDWFYFTDILLVTYKMNAVYPNTNLIQVEHKIVYGFIENDQLCVVVQEDENAFSRGYLCKMEPGTDKLTKLLYNKPFYNDVSIYCNREELTHANGWLFFADEKTIRRMFIDTSDNTIIYKSAEGSIESLSFNTTDNLIHFCVKIPRQGLGIKVLNVLRWEIGIRIDYDNFDHKRYAMKLDGSEVRFLGM